MGGKKVLSLGVFILWDYPLPYPLPYPPPREGD